MKNKKNVFTWRISLAILLIFGMGFLTGKITNIDFANKTKGYRINVNKIQEQNAYIDEDYATDCDEDYATDTDEDYATDCDEDYATDADEDYATDCDEDYATDADEDYATASDVNETTAKNLVEKNVEVNIKNEQKDITVDSSKITDDVIKNIKKSTGNVIITAENNTIISKNVFDAVKQNGKITLIIKYLDNQYVFYAKDIDTTRDVNVKVITKTVEEEQSLRDYSFNGIVLDFEDNGSLPNNTVTRIKATTEIDRIITGTNAKLYRYNEETDSFELVQTNITKDSEGYYNLAILHHSKYILTNSDTRIYKQQGYTTGNNSNEVVSFVDSHLTYLIVIAVSLVVIIVVIIIIIVNKKHKKTNDFESDENKN